MGSHELDEGRQELQDDADEHRFWVWAPSIRELHIHIVTRQLHAEGLPWLGLMERNHLLQHEETLIQRRGGRSAACHSSAMQHLRPV